MIPENVTLIVKAPNQQIEDQNINCQSSWTVKELKGHLSQVYPNKPSTEEQKIIYSGQLLEDSAILKDVLRTYDNQPAHTMHLVCSPSRRMTEPARSPDATTEGLRRRAEPAPEAAPRAETSQNHQNHTMEMQNYLNSAMNYGRVPPYPGYGPQTAGYGPQAAGYGPQAAGYGPQIAGYGPQAAGYVPQGAPDGASLANHMMVMQQAYMQYMQQYALWQASLRGEAAPAAAAAPGPPAAPEPAAEDDERRDWLDHLYAASRLAILSSLVYLYGSGARLLLVVVLAVAGYLHQMGFFRELNLNRNNPNRPAGNRNQPANNGNQVIQNDNQVMQNGNQGVQNGNEEVLNGNQGVLNGNQGVQNGNQVIQNGNQPETEQPADDQRSLWSVTWMIFTTFFASLIPEANQ